MLAWSDPELRFGYCIMDNHFHLLIQTIPDRYFSDEEIKNRLGSHYGTDGEMFSEKIDHYREKLSKLSNYMKEVKQAFSWY